MKLWPFGSSDPVVSVIRLSGVISPAAQPFRSALNMAGLAGALQQGFSARGVKAVALAINSPGGSPVQSALIGKRVRDLAREKDVPVFAFVEDVAASGGYWLACAADEIFADESSIVGSIGVVSAGFGFPEALKKLGIERRIYTEGTSKAALDPFRPEQADDVARLRELQKDIHSAFKSHVRDRRGKRLKAEDGELFNGDIWTGSRALELGLIDGLGDLRSVLRDRFGESVRLRVIGPSRGWLRRRMGFSRWPGSMFEPGDLVSGLLDAVEARALWARFGL